VSNVIVTPNECQALIYVDTKIKARYISGMNFPKLIAEILERGYTFREIAEKCGLSSAGHAHDLQSGRQKKVNFESGTLLCNMHRVAMRRKVRK